MKWRIEYGFGSEYVATVQEIDEIQATGLDNTKKVKRHNKLADRLRAIACEIDGDHPEMKSNFYQLLPHRQAAVRIWAAHHILELMSYGNDCKGNALKEIYYVAMHDDSADGLGNKLWFEPRFAQYPEDRNLL